MSDDVSFKCGGQQGCVMTINNNFKPGPWAGVDNYKALKRYASKLDEGWDVADDDGRHLRAALHCMELVPILVEALEKVQWRNFDADLRLMSCPDCSHHSPSDPDVQLRLATGGLCGLINHSAECVIGNALKAVRGDR